MDTAVRATPARLTPGQQKALQAVVQHIRREGMAAGEHLTESSLAQLIGTSRSPVRVVLDYLQSKGVTRYDRNRGYFLALGSDSIPADLLTDAHAGEDPVYLRLATFRFEGKLPDSVTETEVSRLLDASRAEVHKALLRAQDEGWAEKATGYGWELLPMVDSLEAYDDLYAVRIALEPACVLNPKFRPDKAELAALRREQQELSGRDPATLSPIEVFESNARFHATIAGWSHNQVAIQILRRLDRVRRLAEYRQAARPLPRQVMIHEHCDVLDAIESGDTLTAASLLRAHLDSARRKKVIPTAFGPQA